MLNRAWRIVLLVIAAVLMLWPSLFTGSEWVAFAAVIILLIGEITGHNKHRARASAPVRRRARSSRRRKRRR